MPVSAPAPAPFQGPLDPQLGTSKGAPGSVKEQHRLTPIQRRVFGGCHIDRPIGGLVAGAGLEPARLDNYYMKGPRAFGYVYDGVATKPSGP